jgi:flagellar biosynthesis protein FlhF
MRVKSYFADSVQEAIDKARQELGPEAMLMNSKKTDFELRALGSVEVVFGLPGQTAVSKPRLQVSAGSTPPDDSAHAAYASAEPGPVVSAEVAQELADLRRQIETVKRTMGRQHRGVGSPDEKNSRTVENLCARLVAADISEDLAQEIAEACELQAYAWKQSPGRQLRDFEMIPAENLELALSAELHRRLNVSPELGVNGAKQKIVLFVGPAGAGKTTSLIKLGLRCGLQARLPMHILSLDTLRVGGWEHLAAYARIAGLGFDAVHNLTALDQLLVQYAEKKLILIDTPGFGRSESEDLNDLGTWVRRFPSVDVQLVLPATLRPSVIKRTFNQFAVLKPAKLLLTHVDEVDSPGVILDVAMSSGLPLSYLSNGHTIPEDIAQASKTELLSFLMERRSGRSNLEAA